MSFFNKRPTISPAAIKRLYQFGYICSGTACGLVTLCLEEQRRRIQLLQRIADNAKAVRQHPRYRSNSNVALAAEDGHGDEDVWLMQRRRQRRRQRGKETVFDDNERDKKAVWSAERRLGARSLQDHELGSDHNHFQQNDGAPDHSFAHLPPLSRTENTHARLSNSQIEPIARAPNASEAGRHSLQNRRGWDHDTQDDNTSFRMLQAPRRGTSGQFDWPLVFQQATDGLLKTLPSQASDSTPARFVTQAAWQQRGINELDSEGSSRVEAFRSCSNADVTRDVNEFFCCVNPVDHKQMPSSHPAGFIASRLLEMAVIRGMLEEVRSLCLWKLSADLFTKSDAEFVCRGCTRMAQIKSNDLHELLAFYVNLIASFPSDTPLESAMEILKSALRWDLDIDQRRLCTDLFSKILDRMSEASVMQVLGVQCQTLLSHGDVTLAADLLMAFTKARPNPVAYSPVADETIDAAIENGHFSSCVSLLRWKLTGGNPHRQDSVPRRRYDQWFDSCRHQLNALIAACAERDLQGMLVDLFCREHSGLPIPFRALVTLGRRSVKHLAFAASTDPTVREVFETLYRRLAPPARKEVDTEWSVPSLKTTWRVTRNLDVVHVQFKTMSQQLKDRNDIVSLRKLDEALLEIYISGNKLDRALKVIVRNHKAHGADSILMCLSTLLLARKGAWEMLTKVLALAQRSKSINFDSESTRIFNETIRIYAQMHNPSETWKFVADCVRLLNFKPNRGTSMVVLQHFASNEALDYIPKWLAFLKERQLRFTLDAQAAIAMMRRYYVDHRPHHIILMWLCRKLSILSPALAGEDLIDLIKQAIGYDLRHRRPENALQRPQMRLRLQQLQDAGGHVPSPGLSWNGQLFLPPSDSGTDVANRALTEPAKSNNSTETFSAIHSPALSPRGAPAEIPVKSSLEENGARRMFNPSTDATVVDSQEEIGSSRIQMQKPSSQISQQGTTLDSKSANIERDESASSPFVEEERGKPNIHFFTSDESARLDCAPSSPVVEFNQSESDEIMSPIQANREEVALSHTQNKIVEDMKSVDESLWQAWTEDGGTSRDLSKEMSQADITTSDSTPLHSHHEDAAEDMLPAFTSLRPDYEDDLTQDFQSERVLNTTGRKKLEGDMMVPFSLGDYQKVLEMYNGTLDGAGLPASVRVLEIAVEACLRLYPGDKSHAENLLSDARFAGMNVTCALGPMLIHDMNRFKADRQINVEAFRRTVIEYYRMNDENGWPVQHHVGVNAAHILMVSGHAIHGLNLLTAIYTSEWAKHRPFNIVAMTTFLRGYLDLGSIDGIRWVVRTVLEKNMRINHRFLRQLRWPLRERNARYLEKIRGVSGDCESLLKEWINLCWERWQKQMADSNAFGQTLVNQIAASASEDSAPISPSQLELDIPHFASNALQAGDDTSTSMMTVSPIAPNTIQPTYPTEHARRIADYQREQIWRKRKIQALREEKFDRPNRHWRFRTKNTLRLYKPTFESYLVRDAVVRTKDDARLKPTRGRRDLRETEKVKDQLARGVDGSGAEKEMPYQPLV